MPQAEQRGGGAVTDRELIELAAKAAGIIVWMGNGFQDDTYFTDAKAESGVVVGVEWNPLTSDADAFRPAVKLGILVLAARGFAVANASDSCGGVVRIPSDDDTYAATRRAITMAAAKIAKERTS